MYKIGILQNIHEEGIRLFEKNKSFDYEIIDDLSESNLLRKISSFDGITLRTTKLTNEVLSRASKLKVISRHGVGYDNVDTNYLKKKNICLLITATANAQAVSEHVFYMMLTISKNFLNLDNEVRSGNFKNNFNKFQTFELNNKDFLSIHMPFNKDTKDLINYNRMKTMKKNIVIINTARGGIINEQDLHKALNEEVILAAGLDVFINEPINIDNPLLNNKRIILTPHTAALTNECKIRMAKETSQNIINFFEKKIDKNMIVKI